MAMNLGYQTGSPIGGFTKGLQAGAGLRQQREQGQRQDRQLGMQEDRLEMDAAQAERMKVKDEQAAKDMERKRGFNTILQDKTADQATKVRTLYNIAVDSGKASDMDMAIGSVVSYIITTGDNERFKDLLPQVNQAMEDRKKGNKTVRMDKNGDFIERDELTGEMRVVREATRSKQEIAQEKNNAANSLARMASNDVTEEMEPELYAYFRGIMEGDETGKPKPAPPPVELKPITQSIIDEIKSKTNTKEEAMAMAIKMGYDPNTIGDIKETKPAVSAARVETPRMKQFKKSPLWEGLMKIKSALPAAGDVIPQNQDVLGGTPGFNVSPVGVNNPPRVF